MILKPIEMLSRAEIIQMLTVPNHGILVNYPELSKKYVGAFNKLTNQELQGLMFQYTGRWLIIKMSNQFM